MICEEVHPEGDDLRRKKEETVKRVPKYRKTKQSLESLREIAKSRGGDIEDVDYVDLTTYLPLRCSAGHEWTTKASHLAHGHWCPTCYEAGGRREQCKLKNGLDQAQTIAKQKGGQCLTTEFCGTKAPISWKCQNGHNWEASLNSVKNHGTWCPYCVPWLRERVCRDVFEKLYQTSFPKRRPFWLDGRQDKKGCTCLELDGYNEELGVAFEHQGRQHYENVEYFFRGGKCLETTRERDQIKRERCHAKGVILVEIPFTIEIEKIIEYISSELTRLSAPIPPVAARDVVLSNNHSDGSLMELHAAARAHGGECLSSVWLGVEAKYKFRCLYGHEWLTAGAVVMRGGWCRKCANNALTQTNRKTDGFAILKAAAERKGGSIVDEEYHGVTGTYTWKCAEGHTWSAKAGNITHRKSWCPVCAIPIRGNSIRHSDGLVRLQGFAASRNGEILSPDYTGIEDLYRCRCAEGHEFSIRGKTIVKGSWCRKCGYANQPKNKKARERHEQEAKNESV